MNKSALIIFWTLIGTFIILIIFLVFIYQLLRLYKRRHLEYNTNLLLTKAENEKEILRSKIDVHEETIQKISQEIHDNVNQLLAFAKLNLNLLIPNLDGTSSSKIESSIELISSAIEELNNLSRSQSAEIINNVGLAKAMELEADRIKKIETINIEFDFNSDLEKDLKNCRIIIYRIFQEALRNAIIHGKAKNIIIELLKKENTIQFSITDDGVGFDVRSLECIQENAHHGIKNIKKRLQLLDGEFQISSRLEKGTQIKMILPIPNQ